MLLHIQSYITKRVRLYQNGSNRCNLCLEEKIAILQANPVNTLKQRTEIVLKVDTKPFINQVIIKLIKPYLTQIG